MILGRYRWAGGEEAMLRFGAAGGVTAVVVPPILEEHNRVRSVLSAVARGLAARGIGAVLPDLPGQGDSALATAAMRLEDLRVGLAAAVAAAGGRCFAVGLRSGALLDGAAEVAGRWHLAPQTGDEALREWERLRVAGGGGAIGGNRVAADMLAALRGVEPLPARVVRLAGDPRPADRVIEAAPPWRRAEPGEDPVLADLLAEDIAAWIASCAD